MPLVLESLQEARCGSFDAFAYEYEFKFELYMLWGPEPESELVVEHRLTAESSETFDTSIVSFCRNDPAPTPWSIAFTPTFRKSIASVDRKLQGRVLAALSDLSETPIASQGDTKTPLVGQFKGLWRLRIGDYRLLYEPQVEKRLVVILDFSARSGVYEP